jgi:ribosomal protein L29
MGKTLAIDELRKMQEADLLRELSEQYRTVARLKQAVQSGKEKASHLYKREKTQLARMLTVLSQLRHSASTSTLPASAKASADKPAPVSS